jgi:hypothetical protein
MSDAIIQASNIEIPIADLYQTHFGAIDDLSTLWRIDDLLKKHIRKLEKNAGARKRRVRDPNAPKKEASPQLLAWNEQVHRIAKISKQSAGGEIAYNHALKVGGILKAAGHLSINKAGNTIPDDETILDAVNSYHESHNPPPKAESKKSAPANAVKEEAQAQTEEKPKTAPKPKGKKDEKPAPSAKAETDPETANVDIDTYTFIIGGKSYERGDLDGRAFIWDQKGVYMGVFNEKTKKFDTSIPDPTA